MRPERLFVGLVSLIFHSFETRAISCRPKRALGLLREQLPHLFTLHFSLFTFTSPPVILGLLREQHTSHLAFSDAPRTKTQAGPIIRRLPAFLLWNHCDVEIKNHFRRMSLPLKCRGIHRLRHQKGALHSPIPPYRPQLPAQPQ